MTRAISHAGLRLIKLFEGCELKAYVCPAGVLTVGYGHTGPDVKRGMVIDAAKAEALLRADLVKFESAVNRYAPKANQSQFDAMVSFAYNVGAEAFRNSTLLKLHNAGKYADAAAQFARWNKGGGKVLRGLVDRRAAEKALYLAEGAA